MILHLIKMPRPRRYYEARRVYFATARLRRGLPLVPNELMNSLILGILGSAYERYPLRISDFIFMGNHFHILFVCEDTQVVVNFFKYIKGEIARSINKLTGSSGPVWQGRTDMPIVLDSESCIRQLVYLYSNPVESRLVSSIDEYPGVNSWENVLSEREVREYKAPRYYVHELKKLDKNDSGRSAEKLKRELDSVDKRVNVKLKTYPFAWLKSFDDSISVEDLRSKLISFLKEKIVTTKVIGKKLLKSSCIFRKYYPKKYSQRVYCIAKSREDRQRFVRQYRSLVEEAREVWRFWIQGKTILKMPPGMLSPPIPVLLNAV